MNRKYFKLGYALFLILPVSFVLLIIIFASLSVGHFFISFLFTLALFFGLSLHLRWVLYIEDAFVGFFFIKNGYYKLPYKLICLIQTSGSFSGGIVLIFKYKYKNKILNAKFEVNSYSYMIEVLNFLHERVENEVIKNSDFEKMGIFFIDGKYQKRGIHSKKL
jgi:hypothetical protein